MHPQTNLIHFRQWIEQQRVYHGATKQLSKRDMEIFSHAYCRQFPNRLPFILAELIDGMPKA